jgi:asparagine synthase (glutamine-hydrolysing)
MRERLPDATIGRPKRGFGVPMSDWLRGALKPLVDDYLAGDRLLTAGYFDPEQVAAIRTRHERGNSDAGDQLWLLLQFELWRERWLESAPVAAHR